MGYRCRDGVEAQSICAYKSQYRNGIIFGHIHALESTLVVYFEKGKFLRLLVHTVIKFDKGGKAVSGLNNAES